MEIMNWGEGLPPAIGKAIFSRLVVSDLAACSVVCKTWNALILDYASSSKFLTTDFILFTRDRLYPICGPNHPCNSNMHFLRFDNLDVDFDLELEVNKSVFDDHLFSIQPINSCNGLLLIVKHNCCTFCTGIFNPMTNEFFQVPHDFKIDDERYRFGLGFIPATKQYKLFRVTRIENPGSGSINQMEVLTFGRSEIINPKHYQWRHLYSLPVDIAYEGAYMNGVVYWLGKEQNKQDEYVVYTLDVETEKIKLSAVLEVGPFPTNSFIQQFNGSVYAIFHIHQATRNASIQVWKMQENGSWIRDFVIVDDHLKGMGPITLMKAYENGEILFMVKLRYFWLYNPFTGTKKIITIKNKKRILASICQIEAMNFGNLPNILAGDDSRLMKSRRRSKLLKSRRRSKLMKVRRRLMRSILMKSRSRLLRNILTR